jgi:hypothetical protein
MNRKIRIVLLLVSLQTRLLAQELIKSDSLSISSSKTTHLIFPLPVKSVDRGTTAILVQRVKGAENILRVKAGKAGFPETNLSVLTADGRFYSFIVDYKPEPPSLTIYFSPLKEGSASGVKNNIHGLSDKRYKMSLYLRAIYIKQETIVFKLEFRNRSHIPYDVDIIRFSIADKRKTKRVATQEREIKPVYETGNDQKIQACKTENCLFAFSKFTMPEGKYLSIEVMEKNGGRRLRLQLKNRFLANAQALAADNYYSSLK